ncbi:MAG: GlsB/YeaQ/YmgE family stress response membrane protein [Bacteroidales bacterium]|nr:GlsB/YeaQ/YmgE family stress response membrane protein [Bacteroidales bacterium]
MDTVQISFKSLFDGIDNPLILVLIGLASGYVAGKLMSWHESRIGLIASITVGVLGSLLAGWLFPKIGITFTDNIWGQFLQGLIGAILILAVINKLKR